MLQTAERDFVAAVLRRDRKAAAEFVTLHADALYGYVRHRLLPRADLVEDLVQEIFLAAWQQLPGYRGESTLQNWLLGIARHKVQDYYRARLRDADELLDEGTTSSHPIQFPNWDELLDGEAALERTRRVMSGLPEAYQCVLLWRYWDECSAREMARLAGKTEKGVERLLARAREQFKKGWIHE